MSGRLNRVMLLGDLASPPEVYVTRGGKVEFRFVLATTESYLDEDDIQRDCISYIQVVVLGRRAEALSKRSRRRCGMERACSWRARYGPRPTRGATGRSGRRRRSSQPKSFWTKGEGHT